MNGGNSFAALSKKNRPEAQKMPWSMYHNLSLVA
jgi:hypothetical protein